MERTWIRKSSLLRSQMETLATQATMVRGRNTHAVCCEENYTVYLVFSIRLFSIVDLFAVH